MGGGGKDGGGGGWGGEEEKALFLLKTPVTGLVTIPLPHSGSNEPQ